MNMLPRLDYIEFICTTVCNKRCKNCSNYIPQLGALQRHVSGEAFAEQLRILLSRVSYVEKMQIHGGEPLLNPDILQIIEELKKERDRIGKIRIITNGTVVLKETLIDALKGSRIQLAISNYLFNQESRKQIINQCIQNSIEYVDFDEQQWYQFVEKKGSKFDMKQGVERYNRCPIAGYACYHNYVLYLCSRLCNMKIKHGYVEICGVDLRKQELKEYMSDQYKQGCFYCGIDTGLKVIAGEQS